ncbi:hypothetical protein MTR_4g016667 [Medicago truncatula]|uniref:Uncharacterized protein n=1 Tax=Medicago truncatula TaxID=3880 RepID=A0A072UIL0_MEDTR|nr:hypothetical protein MTR_4g016667 [Medicago truncatula]
MVAAISQRKRMAADATVSSLSLPSQNSFCPSPTVLDSRSQSLIKPSLSFIASSKGSLTSHHSLNITLSSGDLNELLYQISAFPLNIKLLALYHPIKFPKIGLRAFSLKMKNLTSITCYRIASGVDKSDLFFIADCFPLLEELMLSRKGYPPRYYHDDDQLLALPKLRKIALSRNFLGNQSINHLCKNCDLQDVKVIEVPQHPLVIGPPPLGWDPRHLPVHAIGWDPRHMR